LVEYVFQCMNRLQANRQGRAGLQNIAETAKYVLRNPQYVPVCTPQKRKKSSTKSIKRVCTEYIQVHTVFKTASMYQVHTFKLKYVLQNIHF
jgi:hypothetical protein